MARGLSNQPVDVCTPRCGHCQEEWILFKDGHCERCDRQDPFAKVRFDTLTVTPNSLRIPPL